MWIVILSRSGSHIRQAGSTPLTELSRWPHTAWTFASLPVWIAGSLWRSTCCRTETRWKLSIWERLWKHHWKFHLRILAEVEIQWERGYREESLAKSVGSLGDTVEGHQPTQYWQRERRWEKKEGTWGSDTLAGGGGFLPKGSEDPNWSFLSVFLKKSSDEVPLKGSFSLNGSPPNGSGKKKEKDCDDVLWIQGH